MATVLMDDQLYEEPGHDLLKVVMASTIRTIKIIETVEIDRTICILTDNNNGSQGNRNVVL